MKEQSALVCGVRFRFTIRGKDLKRSMLSIHAEYALAYNLTKGFAPRKEIVQIFAGRNAVFNAWPFFRELVSSMAAKMSLPAPVLPLLKVSPLPPR